MLAAPVTVTPPSVEPIALPDARAFVGAAGTALDDRLTPAIGMTRAALESTTGLRLIDQVVEVGADSFADLARLNVGPVKAVSSITYRDTTGATQTLDPAAYELRGAGLDRGIRSAIGTAWPTVDGRGGAITARLSVGFGAVPAAVPRELNWAMLALIRAGIDDAPTNIEPLIANWRIYS